MQIHKMLIRTRFQFLFIAIFFFAACDKRDQPVARLTTVKVLNDYPSGSGLAYLDGYIYMIGDDATDVLKMDSQLNIIDRTGLFISSQKRIPKM